MTQSFARPRPDMDGGNDANRSCDNDKDNARRHLIRDVLDGIKDRAQQRRLGNNNARMDQPDTAFENEGGIASIQKPKSFGGRTANDEFGRYVEYKDNKTNTKLCYWKREDYSPEADSAKKIAEILKKGPHTILTKDPKHPDMVISEKDEVDPVYDCLQPGRWAGGGGAFDVTSISVKQVNGKNVLSVDLQFEGGKKSTLTIFNPDPKAKTLEHIWTEGKSKSEVDRVNQAALKSIKWKVK